MKTMRMRVIDKSGVVLGRVSTLSVFKGSVFKGSVSYVKADGSGVVISVYPAMVDVQYTIDDQNWETVLIPSDDDVDLLDDLRIMRGAR